MTDFKLAALGAINGAIAILTSAFGAHALKAQLAAEAVSESQYSSFSTGADMHLTHAILLVIIGICHGYRVLNFKSVFWLTQIAIGIFAGSLYWYGLGGPKLLVLATPLGGILLLASWIILAIMLWRHKPG